jgi:AcrR family transcriptional regulator
MKGSSPRLGAGERKEQLLSAALETFGAKGFNATSMNDVAAAAGVTKPVLYQHFESKHQLYLELLSDIGASLITAIEEATQRAGGPREQVEESLRAFFHFFGDEPANFTVLFGEGVRSDEAFLDKLHMVEDAHTSLTADLIEIESLSRDDRVVLANSISGMLEGAVRRWIQEGKPHSPDEIAALISELAWRGLRGVGTDH